MERGRNPEHDDKMKFGKYSKIICSMLCVPIKKSIQHSTQIIFTFVVKTNWLGQTISFSNITPFTEFVFNQNELKVK